MALTPLRPVNWSHPSKYQNTCRYYFKYDVACYDFIKKKKVYFINIIFFHLLFLYLNITFQFPTNDLNIMKLLFIKIWKLWFLHFEGFTSLFFLNNSTFIYFGLLCFAVVLHNVFVELSLVVLTILNKLSNWWNNNLLQIIFVLCLILELPNALYLSD